MSRRDPTALISITIRPKTELDGERLERALQRLTADDPTLIADVRIRLCDGSYHDVESSDAAFSIAGARARAFQNAAQNAGPVLVEPVMRVEVVVSAEHLAAVRPTSRAAAALPEPDDDHA